MFFRLLFSVFRFIKYYYLFIANIQFCLNPFLELKILIEKKNYCHLSELGFERYKQVFCLLFLTRLSSLFF